jgi:hypothetical protein
MKLRAWITGLVAGVAFHASSLALACQPLYCVCDVRWHGNGQLEQAKAGRIGSNDATCNDQFQGDGAGKTGSEGSITSCRSVTEAEYFKKFPKTQKGLDADLDGADACSSSSD